MSSCPACLQPPRPDLLAIETFGMHALKPAVPNQIKGLPHPRHHRTSRNYSTADAADLARDLTARGSSSCCCSAPRARGVAQAMPRHGLTSFSASQGVLARRGSAGDAAHRADARGAAAVGRCAHAARSSGRSSSSARRVPLLAVGDDFTVRFAVALTSEKRDSFLITVRDAKAPIAARPFVCLRSIHLREAVVPTGASGQCLHFGAAYLESYHAL